MCKILFLESNSLQVGFILQKLPTLGVKYMIGVGEANATLLAPNHRPLITNYHQVSCKGKMVRWMLSQSGILNFYIFHWCLAAISYTSM